MSLAKNLNQSELPERSPAYQAAFTAAIWGMPIVSVDAMRQAFFRDAHANYNDILYWSKPADWNFQITTPNASSHYVYFNINTKDGPLVLEVPAAVDAGLFGSILDAWQVPLVDVGPEGEDRGKGGKYLLLPPHYKGNISSGYIPVLFETFNGYCALRAIPGSSSAADLQKTMELVRKLSLYPLSRMANPPQTHFIDMSGRLFDGIVRFDERFYQSLARMVNEEPVLPHDLALVGQLHSIGIEKDREFEPDATMQNLLKKAAHEAHVQFMDRAPKDGATYWANLHWRSPSVIGAQTAFKFETARGLDIDARGLVYFLACAPPARLGKASFYLSTFVDGSGHLLSGENNYRLHVPAPVPASQFWALTIYDSETAAFIRNSPRVELNSYNSEMRKNSDGSVDLYIGPTAPALKESNWIYTVPEKNFFAIFRLYGPGQSLFDKTWQLPDIEKSSSTGGTGRRKTAKESQGTRKDVSSP